ncbi:MAG TPA: DUF6602 domain-containing protein [Thermoanaerobaculia bacterium]|nr:DUF6602 domain-containing protein [Thermoanaerobaculia bacterium]
MRAEFERRMASEAFDSGLPIEEVVREEFRTLVPARYTVKAGKVVDATGFSAGDCDLVLFNDLWFPAVKPGPIASSRSVILPIEGVYAVGEIKQTLSIKTLDDGLEKLVKCHRLERPETFAHRLVENREHCSCVHGLSNPLYTFILAVDIEGGSTFQDLIERFFDVCSTLRRLDIVRAMCVLGQGTVIWGYQDPTDPSGIGSAPALFMEEDLFKPIYPIYVKSPECGPALYTLIQNLSLHLFHSVLAPEDFAANYGPLDLPVKVPTDHSKISLEPEPEWLNRLKEPCSIRHRLD